MGIFTNSLTLPHSLDRVRRRGDMIAAVFVDLWQIGRSLTARISSGLSILLYSLVLSNQVFHCLCLFWPTSNVPCKMVYSMPSCLSMCPYHANFLLFMIDRRDFFFCLSCWKPFEDICFDLPSTKLPGDVGDFCSQRQMPSIQYTDACRHFCEVLLYRTFQSIENILRITLLAWFIRIFVQAQWFWRCLVFPFLAMASISHNVHSDGHCFAYHIFKERFI